MSAVFHLFAIFVKVVEPAAVSRGARRLPGVVSRSDGEGWSFLRVSDAARVPLDMRTCLTLFSKVLKDCSSTCAPKRLKIVRWTRVPGTPIRARRNACAVISLVASFWRFQTPSLWVKASKCMRHFGLTRTCVA